MARNDRTKNQGTKFPTWSDALQFQFPTPWVDFRLTRGTGLLIASAFIFRDRKPGSTSDIHVDMILWNV